MAKIALLKGNTTCPKIIKKNAKSVGLNIIDKRKYYLYKVGAKTPNGYGYPNNYFVIHGTPHIIGNETHVWLVFLNNGDWFKTSHVLNATAIMGGYVFETENSYYQILKDRPIA